MARPALADIAGLLDQLQGDDELDAAATMVVGMGVDHPSTGAVPLLPAVVVQGLHALQPEAAWIAP
jgi:hypothetical protein